MADSQLSSEPSGHKSYVLSTILVLVGHIATPGVPPCRKALNERYANAHYIPFLDEEVSYARRELSRVKIELGRN